MRLSFGLRHIWIVVSAIALVMALAYTNSVIAATFAVIGMLCIWASLRMLRRRHLIVSGMLCIAAGACTWFAIVDKSVYGGTCPICLAHIEEQRIRLFGWRLIQQREISNDPIAMVAADLGVPCSHSQVQLELQQRFLGLRFCSFCVDGIDDIAGELSWYNDETHNYVQEFAQKHSAVGDEFRKRVLEQHDLAFYHRVLDAIETHTLEHAW